MDLRAGAMTVVWLGVLACASPPAAPTGGVRGAVKLEGASDAAGIVVTLVGPVSAATVTDAAGAYAFAQLADGTYAVTAAAAFASPASVSASVTVSSGGAAEAPPLQLTALGELEGLVTLEGNASGNGGIDVFVEGTGFSGHTDDAGRFVLGPLPAGDHVLTASRAGYLTASTPITVSHAMRATAPTLDLMKTPVGAVPALRGIVELVGLGPQPGVAVAIEGTGLGASSNDAGEYYIPMVPFGALALTYEKGPYRERLPAVVSLPGGEGYVVGDSELAPLSRPLELQRGTRLPISTSAFFQLSPDKTVLAIATRLSATQYQCDVLAMTQAGAITTVARGVRCFSQFTPDGTKLLYASQQGDLFIAPLSGGAPTRITGSYGALAFSPDGTKLAVLSRSLVGDASRIEVFEPSTGTLRLVTNDGYSAYGVNSLKFTTDSRWLLFSERSGSQQLDLLVFDTQTGVRQLLTHDVASYAYDLMPDQAHAWALSVLNPLGDGQLAIFPLDGGPRTLVDTHVSGTPVPSRSGKEIAYVTYNWTSGGTVMIAPLDGGTPRVVVNSMYVFEVVEGGDRLLLQAGGALTTVPFAGGPATVLAFDGGPYAEHFAGDARWIVFSEGDLYGSVGTLRAALADGGSAQTLSMRAVGELAISPDAGQVLFRELSDDGGTALLRLAELGSGSVRTLGTGAVTAGPLNFSSDGRALAWVDNGGRLFAYRDGAAAAVQLAAAAQSYPFSYSADLAWVQWYERDPRSASDTLMVRPADGGAPATALLSRRYDATHFNDPFYIYVPPAFWFGGNFVAPRGASPSPYGLQDGWYLLPMP